MYPVPLFVVLFLIFNLSACSLFVSEDPATPNKPPPPSQKEEVPKVEAKLRLLSSEEVLQSNWGDDQDFAGLARAVEQSLRYYKRLPKTRMFAYGEFRYSAPEMVASLQLFLNTIQSYSGDARLQEIRKKFHFFESKKAEGENLFTGYYQPTIQGSLIPSEKYPVPLYARPDDLLNIDLGAFKDKWKGERIRGKVQGKTLVPFDSRDEISYQASLDGRAQPLAYVSNHIELFFLQIQGSGLLELQDKSVKYVNYAAQNGHRYYAIGRLLVKEDKIPLKKMSMQAIKDYLYSHPEEVKRILNSNPSYTFFRILDEGPLGNIEVPLTPERSIAMDHKLIPRGGLAFIDTQVPKFEGTEVAGWKPMTRFMMVQDTGGAIVGHGRADIFWGHGKAAELSAGHMAQPGRLFLLVARKEHLRPAGDLISQH